MNQNSIRTIVVTALCVLLFPLMASAGFLLKDPPSYGIKLGFRFLHPNFEQGGTLTALSGAYDLSVSIPLGRSLTLVGQLPIANYNDGVDTENEVGNIYLGIQRRLRSSRNKNLNLMLGVYLPTLRRFENTAARLIGMDSNFTEFFKYIPEMTTIYGGFSFFHAGRDRFTFGFEAGSYVMVSQDDPEGNTQFLVQYGVGAGYRLSSIILSAEFLGLHTFDDRGLPNPVDSSEFASGKSIHALTFGLQWTYGTIRPGVFYKIYLRDDFNDAITSVVGFKLDISLRTRRY